MTENKSGLTKSIKAALIYKNISKKDLAAIIETDPQQIYNALYRDTFINKTGYKIAAALNCDIVLKDRETGKTY